MTTLIYRSVPHARPQISAAPRQRVDLIYRGVRHDGLRAEALGWDAAQTLSYRGCVYTRLPGGRIVLGGATQVGPQEGVAVPV